MNKNILIIPILFLLTIFVVNAYNTNDLVAYYSYDSNTSFIVNNVSLNYNLIGDDYCYNLNTTNKKHVNAITFNGCTNLTGLVTAFDDYFFNNTFSINVWEYQYGYTGTQKGLCLSNTSAFTESTSGFKNGTFCLAYLVGTKFRSDEYGGTHNTIFSASDNLTISSWNMLTLTYNNGLWKYYRNGVFVVNGTYTLTNNFKYLKLPSLFPYGSIDDGSIWNKTLSQTDITTLYNANSGLDYTETLNGGVNYSVSNTTNTTYTNDTFLIGNNTFSKQQCINIGNGLDYLCTDTFYNPYDNAFYCNLNNTIPCGTNSSCITNLFDNTTQELFLINDIKDCSQITNLFQTINLKCLLIRTENVLWNSINPLFVLLNNNYDYNCSVLNYYPISTTTYCIDSSVNDILVSRPNDNFYTSGECVSQACTNFCTPNTYQCGSLSQSQKCTLQGNGCYDWTVNENCKSGDICKNTYGTCSPIITNNTCGINADCPQGSGCVNGVCIVGQSSTSWLDGGNLNKGFKYLIVLFVILVTFGCFVVVGFQSGVIRGTTILGIIVSCFELVMFAVLGWIPVWLIIMLIILGVASAVLIGRSAQGSSGV